ncbi:MAG: helix-turn-helix domain-containing protein [Eubacteriales bacterium]|nr:helix-turn-helix domain-containing protein [Eubacteriales bacterium]
MNYITGDLIKKLREEKNITQKQLGDYLFLSDKTISKWENNKGLPDISIIEELSKVLNVSITELLTGNHKKNNNKSSNITKIKFYVCPICGNVITSIGEGDFNCCGVNLPEITVEENDNNNTHEIIIEQNEDEYYIHINHIMLKKHYISFISYVTNDTCELKKLYPEQNAEAHFMKKGHGYIFVYCNREGMYKKEI